MIIFIDTNLIFGHWHLKNANFQYLLNYLENTRSILAVSEIVCNEVDNKFFNEMETLKINLKNNFKKSETLINKEFNLDQSFFEIDYSFKKLISEKTDNAEFFDYKNVENSEIVRRAIKKIKPFKEEDKGFRDTLIWLSFLEYVNTKSDNEIMFINNNSSDFFNSDKTDFHDDLKNDLNDLKIEKNFKIYDSIKDFIDKEVGNKHKYTAHIIMEEFIYPNESMIESMVEDYINSQSPNWFSDLLKNNSNAFQDLAYLASFKFHIIEGIEDPDLLNWEQIEENKFFGELNFFFRKVEIELKMPRIIYESRKSSFSESNFFIEIGNQYVNLLAFRKICINISFNFDTNKIAVDNLDINMFSVI